MSWLRPKPIRAQKRYEQSHRGAEAERKRQERAAAIEKREREYDEEDAKLLESYALTAKVVKCYRQIDAGKSFRAACSAAGLNAGFVRNLLQNGADDIYVDAELPTLRGRCSARGVDWRRA